MNETKPLNTPRMISLERETKGESGVSSQNLCIAYDGQEISIEYRSPNIDLLLFYQQNGPFMERRIRWSVSLTSNAYYWRSYGDLGKESMNRIPPKINTRWRVGWRNTVRSKFGFVN